MDNDNHTNNRSNQNPASKRNDFGTLTLVFGIFYRHGVSVKPMSPVGSLILKPLTWYKSVSIDTVFALNLRVQKNHILIYQIKILNHEIVNKNQILLKYTKL